MQTSYRTTCVVANEGGLADLSYNDVSSRACENTSIPFGRIVVKGTSANQCKLPTATGGVVLGATVFVHKEQNSDGSTTYNQYEAVNVMKKGRMFVKPENPVTVGQAVYFRHTAGAGALTVGRFTDSTQSANADLLSGAVYVTATDADGFAIVELNLP